MTEADFRRFDQPGADPAWFAWMLRHRALVAAALVAACWIVSGAFPLGWAT